MAVGLPGKILTPTDLLKFVESGVSMVLTRGDVDYRFLKPEYWKLNRVGELTNAWCTLYIGDEFDYKEQTGLLNRISNIDKSDKFVLLTGISINLSKSPKVIETQVKGFNSPVFQQFSNNSFDITISFNESGPHFWQQNSKNIMRLIEVLDSGETISIANPQLNLIYNIDKLVLKSYSIGQSESFYNQNPISIQLKSDTSTDILSPFQV